VLVDFYVELGKLFNYSHLFGLILIWFCI